MRARGFFNRPDGALRALWRLVGYLLTLFATTWVLTQLTLLIVRPNGMLEAEMVNFCVLLVAIWVAHVVMLRLVDRRPWSDVGLARAQFTPRRIVVGLVLGGLGIGIPSALLLGVHWLRAVPGAQTAGSWLGYAGVMAIFFLPQSLAEEMLVRGYPFAVLREAFDWRWALFFTSAIFGVLHLHNPGAAAQSVLLVTLAGIFLGGVLLLTKSLYAAWMAHFAWNWTMAALLHTAVSGLSVPPPGYRVIDSGPDWATGGVWGPEGGAGAAAGMIAGLWLFTAWRRRRAIHSTEPNPSDTWLNA